eukprot:2061301-Pleurochrysis_carterae.AAC.3
MCVGERESSAEQRESEDRARRNCGEGETKTKRRSGAEDCEKPWLRLLTVWRRPSRAPPCRRVSSRSACAASASTRAAKRPRARGRAACAR